MILNSSFGSKAFWNGFLAELDLEKKASLKSFFFGLIRGPKPSIPPPTTELQKALATQKLLRPRLETIKPAIPQSSPFRSDPFERYDPSIAKIEARRRRQISSTA